MQTLQGLNDLGGDSRAWHKFRGADKIAANEKTAGDDAGNSKIANCWQAKPAACSGQHHLIGGAPGGDDDECQTKLESRRRIENGAIANDKIQYGKHSQRPEGNGINRMTNSPKQHASQPDDAKPERAGHLP